MAHSSIQQINCFSAIQATLETLPKESLVIFDIDDVLITAKDHVLRNPHKEKWLTHYFDSQFTPMEVLQLSSHVWTVYETEITDHKVVNVIETLKNQGIPSIALTAGWNGSMAHRPQHCDDRIRTLRDVGIDFSYAFPLLGETFFHPLENCRKIPSFKDGVVFSCMLAKHTVLEAFLAVAHYTPAAIVFVDDMKINLDRIQAYCQEKAIPYHGFYYTGVEKKDNKLLDEAVAHLQFQTVIQEKRWLKDEEAKALIQLRKKSA